MFNLKIAATILITSTMALLGTVNPAQAGGYDSYDHEDNTEYDSDYDNYKKHNDNQDTKDSEVKQKSNIRYVIIKKTIYHKVVKKSHNHSKYKKSYKKVSTHKRPCTNHSHKPKLHH